MEARHSRLLESYREEKARCLAFAHRQMQGLSSLDPEDVVSEVLHKLPVQDPEDLYLHFGIGTRAVAQAAAQANA